MSIVKKISKIIAIFLSTIIMTASFNIFAQVNQIRQCLHLLDEGKIDEVKKSLPSLSEKYPNDPGVLLLNAMIIENGAEAITLYKNIIINHPQSEFCDQAFDRIIQYFAIIDDTAQSKIYLGDFARKHPESPFLNQSITSLKASLFRLRNNHNLKDLNEIDLSSILILNDPSGDKLMSNTGAFGLQVGIYSTFRAAQNESERFSDMRLLSKVRKKKIANETLYAVVIGDYKTKFDAENAKSIVSKKCDCSPIIFEK